MDIPTSLQSFENSLGGYTGDDPLEEWGRFAQCVEKRLPAGDATGMQVVFDRIVKRFHDDQRYSDDIRYVDYCIRLASYYDDPTSVFAYIHSKGIGTRTAAFYIAWAQQVEQQGKHDQAVSVYQRAMESQAQPADAVLHEYRQFQMRTSRAQPGVLGHGRNPLQDSQVLNQPVTSSKGSSDGLLPEPPVKSVQMISRSENVGVTSSVSSSAGLSRYNKDSLLCEGSEYSFEEVRAAKYFQKYKQEKEQREREAKERRLREEEESVARMKRMLGMLDQNQGATAASRPAGQQGAAALRSVVPSFVQPSARLSQAWTSHGPEQDAVPAPWEHSNRLSDICGSNVSHNPSVQAKRSIHSSEVPLPSAYRAPSIQHPAPQEQQEWSVESSSLIPHRPACVLEVPYQDDGVQPYGPASSLSGGLQQHPIHTDQVPSVDEMTEPEEKLDASQGGTTGNLSHITPNTSMGLAHATPSRALPSPTVNTREAMNAIMDMFQAPTLLEDSNTSLPQAAIGVPLSCKPPTNPTPFTIFMDEDNQENCRAVTAASVAEKPKAARALSVLDVSKSGRPNDTPSELIPEESTMWGPRYNALNSLAACPNSTTDFAMAAHLVSTPSTYKTFREQEQGPEDGWGRGFGDMEENRHRPQSAKLSPIVENESDEKLSETAVGLSKLQGTIVGEGLPSGPQHNATSSFSNTVTQPPPTANKLSFRDVPTDAAGPESPAKATKTPGWQVYVSPQQSEEPASHLCQIPKSSRRMSKSPAFTVWNDFDSPEKAQKNMGCPSDVPMSPECAPKPNWLSGIPSPEVVTEPDLDAFKSPQRAQQVAAFPRQSIEVQMTPEPPQFCALKPNWLSSIPSPEVVTEPDLDAFEIPQRAQQAAAFLWQSIEVPMTPEPPQFYAPKPVIPSPEVVTESDLDAFESPQRARQQAAVPMTPEPPKFCADVPMSPMERSCFSTVDEPMSPDQGLKLSSDDASMNLAVPERSAGGLISDPWDDKLIAHLLSTLSTPLTSCPQVNTWQVHMPNIAPKTQITMGKKSIRVDVVLGAGAFATVYQAIEQSSGKKMILKVQKPGNPWEFHINTQLDARLAPNVRHLFNRFHSAHLFTNGSVLLGEIHNYGTLLDAVNLYKNSRMGDKLMPPPVVMYLTVCILHMVEQLHNIHIVHADIKPDNFLLGERFVKNTIFTPDNLDHGLTLIDLGQSIDMELFPPGTAFTAKCMTSGFQCTEMLSGRPWNYQTDYFGIAGTVYCMLFGTYMQVKNEDGVWKTNGNFRRNPHSELWCEFFHTLLNIPDCGSLPCLSSLRSRLASVLEDNYANKLPGVVRRLTILLMENRPAKR